MAKAYSKDLRSRVMESYDMGEKQRVLAKIFCVSEKTIYLWRKQRAARGHINPITHYQKGHSHKIHDKALFKEFVLKNSHMTSIEMAKAWGNVGRSTIGKNLKEIGFTRKKKLWLQKS